MLSEMSLTNTSNLTSAYVKELDAEHRKRYFLKLEYATAYNGVITLPDPYGGGLSYTNNPAKWPLLSFGDLYTYLIETPGIFCKENLKAFKALDAYKYFLSGFVSAVLYSPVLDVSPVCVLRCNVMHSQRLNEKPVEVWAVLNKENGSVCAAHCQCMAGLGEACSHIGALLFKVEACNRENRDNPACTEQLCQWNRSKTDVKNLKHIPVVEMNFKSSKPGTQLKRRKTAQVKSKAQKLSLSELNIEKLHAVHPQASIFSVLPKMNDESTDSASEDDEHINFDKLSLDVLPIAQMSPEQLAPSVVIDNLKITGGQANEVANVTSGQFKNDLWHKFRFGRITSSVISDVHSITNGSSKQNPELVCQKILGVNPISSLRQLPLPVKWGRSHEGDAVASLKQFLISNGHKNVEVTFPGFFIDIDCPFLGCSTDAVVECSCCGIRPVECKCPYSSIVKPPPQEMDPCTLLFSKYVSYVSFENNCGHLNRTHKHFTQLLCHIGVMNDNGFKANTGYFVVWTKKGILVDVVEHDLDLWETIKRTSKQFFFKYVQPAILKKLTDQDGDCFFYLCHVCKKECKDVLDSVPSIHCSECSNWFHLPCVGLRGHESVVEDREKNWFCFKCKS